MSFSILFCCFFFSSFAFEISCPADVTINCGDDIYDLSDYGNAQYKDYNGWHDAGSPVVEYDLNNCGIGTILRTWSATNPYGNTTIYCSQTLTVDGSSFDESNISWPQTDLEVSGCNPDLSPNALPPGYQTPTWTAGTCAIIGTSYTDKVFYFSGACKKVIRTWEVINCCVYNPYNGHGSWKFNQEINVTISDVPDVTCPSDITVESYDCNGAYVEVPGITVPDTECSDQVTIMNNSPYSANGGADASGDYPLGTTLITFTADYGCWQKTMCQVSVTVTDNTAPTPYCIYGLSIALMGIDADDDGTNEDGMVEVWASDLDKGSYPSCNSTSDLIFSFSDDPTDTRRIFTCDDVGRNDVEIWVTDDQGRQNYCNTYIRVQNNGANIPDCEDSDDFSTISGHVTSHFGRAMGYMELQATATSHEGIPTEVQVYELVETIYDSIVNASGTTIYFYSIDSIWSTETQMEYPSQEFYTYQYTDMYTFEDMHHYNDYQIFGTVIEDDYQSINLADKVMIEAYIAGEETFNTWQLMAADVNQDGDIDEEDVLMIEAILAGNIPSDYDNHWHFFDAAQNMDNMEEGHECEEFCRVQDLQNDTYKVNLIGFLHGDVTEMEMAEEDDDNGIFNGQIHARGNLKTNIRISPNPFQEILTINVKSTQDISTTFTLRNELGQVVLVEKLNVEAGDNMYTVNTNSITLSGVYLYEMLIGDEKKQGKLIKLK
ncbi:T9SS type A sorting domain-containing protein [Saprospiraceae bacterium]|nr:T9SS type A sorting domain-containing protein [Saprospiraceae bacterium]